MNTPLELPSGSELTMSYVIGSDKTVPHLYPEAPEFSRLPPVFATGFAVGLVEWVCMRLLSKHETDPEMITVGAHIDLRHCAPSLPGDELTAWCRFLRFDDGMFLFKVRAHSGQRLVADGTHGRGRLRRSEFEAMLFRGSMELNKT
jgi:fluoroacetyl-CoA thioesterase